MLFIDSNTFYSNAYLKNVKGIHLNGKWTTFGWTECFAFIEKDYENILITFPVENGGVLWNTVLFCFFLLLIFIWNTKFLQMVVVMVKYSCIPGGKYFQIFHFIYKSF